MATTTTTTTAPKPLAARVFLALLITFCGHVAATQYVAHRVHYQDYWLGEPFRVDPAVGVKLYLPHKIYPWAFSMRSRGLDDILFGSLGVALASFLVGLAAFALTGARRKKSEAQGAHGSARWATPEEVKAWGWTETVNERILRVGVDRIDDMMRNNDWSWQREVGALIMGMDRDANLYHNVGKEHVLMFAPTRSGKGVGVVIPTLFMWRGSVVVTDIKGENYKITKSIRETFGPVIYFDPESEASARFNPLFEIEPGDGAILQTMSLARILIPDGKAGDSFWNNGARKVLSTLILYVLYTQEDKSLARCVALLHDDEIFKRMMKVEVDNPEVQRFIRGNAETISKREDKVRSGWIANADNALDLWKDPTVARLTRTSDFRLRDLQYGDRPISLYLVIPPGNIELFSPLVRILFEQLTDTLTRELDLEDTARHRLLMLMDEFPQFGRMAKVEKAVSFTAGYDIKWCFICQGLDQLDAIYGKDNPFLANSHTRIAYGSNDEKNAERLSKLLGKTTGTKIQQGEAGKKGLLRWLDRRSISEVEYERDLMTPGELQSLDPDRAIILTSGKPPVLAHKVRYYELELFDVYYKGLRVDKPTERQDIVSRRNELGLKMDLPSLNPWEEVLCLPPSDPLEEEPWQTLEDEAPAPESMDDTQAPGSMAEAPVTESVDDALTPATNATVHAGDEGQGVEPENTRIGHLSTDSINKAVVERVLGASIKKGLIKARSAAPLLHELGTGADADALEGLDENVSSSGLAQDDVAARASAHAAMSSTRALTREEIKALIEEDRKESTR